VKFWDASAVVPLLLPEHTSDALLTLYEEDPAIAAWWGTRVECASAIERRGRFQANPPVETRQEAYSRLAELASSWEEVQPEEDIRARATRLLAMYDLRAADALQLQPPSPRRTVARAPPGSSVSMTGSTKPLAAKGSG
jgi:predicted nucleic acid-binding protein